MMDDDKAKVDELADARSELADLESGAISYSHGPGAPPYNENRIAKLRARIAELEAQLEL